MGLVDPGAAIPPSWVGPLINSFVLSKRFRMVPSPPEQDYQRSTDPFDKEVIISLTNGLRLFSCDGDDSILSSAFATGHQVRPCLQSLPQNSTPGDDRCKRYRVVDLRTEVRTEGVNSGTSVRAPSQSPP